LYQALFRTWLQRESHLRRIFPPKPSWCS
jgi:hypothetical protein